MDVVSIIRKKRDRKPLSAEEIAWFVDGYTKGTIPDYQASALLMAGFLNGMDAAETVALTRSMLESGRVLSFPELPGRKVDKHSTGGVGDKTSLLLAPIVAACGVYVPMVSGRGLGHTGGTLDKLESIPGFNVRLDIPQFTRVLAETGAGLIGQTEDIAPADRKLYALRDVTATVEHIAFITASIMSKKLAEGIDGLVLDVKSGSGAFMKTDEDALRLAESLVGTGLRYGKDVVAFITDMNGPLGLTAGNWLEVEEAWEGLNGGAPADLMELTHLLAGAMLWLGKAAPTLEEGIQLSEKTVASGKAAQKWLEMVAAQGGDISVFKRNNVHNPVAGTGIEAAQDGFIQSMDTFKLGMSTVIGGAGRLKKEDPVDAHAGIRFLKKTGDFVKKGETIAWVYANKDASLQPAAALVQQAVIVGTTKPESQKLVRYVVGAGGISPFSRT
jgi:pyrimidine-nucleoside phosphorylase